MAAKIDNAPGEVITAANLNALGVEVNTKATTAALNAEASTARAAEALAAQKSANLSDLASATAARTNLGLGSAATTAASAYEVAGAAATAQTAATAAAAADVTSRALLKANNLSGLTDASAARTNLGLGTAATVNTGTGSANVILGNDSRLTDSRTPTAHASTHALGTGNDALNPTENVNAVGTSGTTQTLPDVTSNTIHRITLSANCTLTFPTAAAGKNFTVVLVQDATGSRTVTWPGTVLWPGGTTPTLTTAASKRDVFTFLCADGTNWLGFTAGKNY